MSMKSTLCATVGYIGAALILGSCGGGGGGSTSGGGSGGGGGDTTDPTVSFLVSAVSIGSQGTATSAVTATDNVGVTSGPTVTCTNGGVYANGVFTPPTPAVTVQTVSVCTATASDAAGNSGSGTLTVTINPPTAITLTGTVGKGLVSGATIAVRDAADGFGAEPIATTTTAADGTYSVTLPAGTEASELLVVEAALAGAQMVCDAANCLSELGLAFGASFTVPDNDIAPNGVEIRKLLSTPLPTPALGTTDVNINVFSHYNLMSMVASGMGSPGVPGVFKLEDYASTRKSTADLFGLPDSDFFEIPFIDVSQTITSTSQNDIYAALIGGGVLGAANEADDPFGAVLDLQGDAIGSALIVNESIDDINVISLEDIFENASALATQLNLTTNAFTLAKDALTAREVQIDTATEDIAASSDGTLPSSDD